MYIDSPPPAYIADLPYYVVPQAIFLACSFAYLVGSFPEGFLFVVLKWVKVDLDAIGTRNPEAGDIMRAGKKLIAVVALLFDFLKGPFAVTAGITIGAIFIKYNLSLPPDVHVCIPELSVYMLFLPPIAALLGHVFPIWLDFKGGKGFINAIGILFFLNPVVGAITLVAWLELYYATRRPAVATILSMGLSPLLAMVFAGNVWLELPHITEHFAMAALVMALIVLFKHRNNLHQLRQVVQERKERLMNARETTSMHLLSR
jgi:glycerol-3-phosphate acyltransferase PlsY